jgi:penicillin-binding protein 1A
MPGHPPEPQSRSDEGNRSAARPPSRKLFGRFVFALLILLSAGLGALGGLLFVYSSNLPQVRQLEDYRPDVMTEVFADDGTPVARFALERRVMVSYDQIPQVLRNAVISIEDRRFESHWGVDVLAIIRAAITDIMEWRKDQGASTLTQQLSRVLFLTREKSFRRKVEEALLAIQIERHFTKPQIFTMYANAIPLGSGNYGFEAASEFFFGKPIGELTLSEAALLAGLPRSPTYYSPLLHPERALDRRNQVLAAMLDNGKITRAEYRKARTAPLGLHVRRWNNDIAPYFVEEIRQFLENKYGEEVVEQKGLRVYTTLNVKLQKAAQQALRDGLRADDKRRGWRGPERNILKNPIKLADGTAATLETYANSGWRSSFAAGDYVRGLVMSVSSTHATVRFGKLRARITPPDFAWTGKTDPRDVFSPGDVDLFLIREVKGQTVQAALDQVPSVQGALLAIDNSTGEIKAMVGGYDFDTSKFNRATQAERQVGSSFKVYVYAQALLDGLTPFDKVLDEPVSYNTSSGIWAPHNYDYKYEGPITLLHALAESRNVPAVKILAKVGIDSVIRLCRKFGITSRLVPNLPLALGASDLTLLEHASAFTTFPNDGVHIDPRMILRVTDYNGRLIDSFPPQVTDVLPAGVARLETSMLREVFNSGTAIRARAMAQKYPLAGKTGTTNDFTDAWFVGFSPNITCGVWVGFDDHRTLGRGEEGSRVALPIWTDFMSRVLQDGPVGSFADSPLLTNPAQVKEILASAGPPGQFPSGPTSPELGAVSPASSGQTPASSPPPAKPPLKPAAAAPAPGSSG